LPNTHRDVTDELVKKVATLEKALIAERRAKQALEKLIDQKDQRNLDNYKDLLDALESANNRQIQFQFLAILTQDLLTDKNIDEMVLFFVLNLSKLMENCPVIQVISSQNNHNSISTLNVDGDAWTDQPWGNKYSNALSHMLNQDEFVWHREEKQDNTTLKAILPLLKHSALLYLPLNISKTEQRLIILDIDHYCYDNGFKETLNIAGKQFSSALKKRTTEIELSYNYLKLRATISKLESTQNQLIHNEKMASLGLLSAGVAHEINNPIGFITSNLHVLKEYSDIFKNAFDHIQESSPILINNNPKLAKDLSYAREDLDQLVSSCIEGVNRIADITMSLKAFSKKEKDDFSSINLNEVIKSSLKIVWNQLKYDHLVIENLLVNLPEILGNYGQLQQVLVNLFVNSAQSMLESGELTITSTEIEHYVEVSVTDTGCGMDKSVIKRLFEPFYTTKSEHKGTGLGLSVSYAIIEKHNATISVNSEPNVGSTFTLRFPKLTTN